MELLRKFKIFIVLLTFCVANVFVYRYFSGAPDLIPSLTLASITNSDITTTQRLIVSKIDSIGTVDVDSKAGLPDNTNSAPSRELQAKESGNSTVAVIKTESPANVSLPLCPLVPPNLKGQILHGPLATYRDGLDFEVIAQETPGLRPGGYYSPPNCKARHRVAIVIPYRNRESQLKVFLHNIHPMLSRQQLDYAIFVIDQALPGRFNRAMLMNIGYVEAMKRHDYQCAIFHDVDLIPENDRNIYSCPEQPRHMSAAVDKFNYRLPYRNIFGGVSALTKSQMETVNGFSNLFFGWGGEDDDMATRIGVSHFQISRYPMEVARYRMIKHTHEKENKENPERFKLLRNVKQRMPYDGLNNLFYKVKSVVEEPTHTRIEVIIDEQEVVSKTKPK